MKKSAILLVSICLLCFFSVGNAQAQKIAVINTGKVVKKSPQHGAISRALEAEFKERNDALVSKRKKLKKLEEKLNTDSSNMSPSEAKRIEQDIRRSRRALNNLSAETREDWNIRRAEELNKLLRKIREVVTDLGKREKFDLIVDAGVAYASDQIDISDKVLEQLSQEFNKKEMK